MDDAGPGPPRPTDRRYDQKQMWYAAERMLDMGVVTEESGLDIFWLTEHHFQHEGYEVIPNALLFGSVLAERTETLRIGALFNIVPQWNPLRFAEDFATMHNLSGGRGVLGVGRGTVPREAQTLGSVIGSHDNPDKAEADRINREIFDETMDVILAAFENETFSYRGRHFTYPPPGIPDRGGTVQTLTLVPRPLYPFDTWQAITSPPTLEYVPKRGWGGVFWLKHHRFTAQWWHRFADLYEKEQGESLEVGEKRMLVLNVRVEGHPRRSMGERPSGTRRILEIPGPLRLEPGLHGRGRTALSGGPDPHPGGVGGAEDLGDRDGGGGGRGASPSTLMRWAVWSISPSSRTSRGTPTTRPLNRSSVWEKRSFPSSSFHSKRG